MEDQLRKRIEVLEAIIFDFVKSDRLFISKDLQLLDGQKIIVGSSKGLRIGSGATAKISVYGVAPVIQAGAITAPSGGGTVDSESRTAINSIRTALINFGITA